ERMTVMAIGAHPDDIEFGCGGILLKEASRGTRIHMLVCSKGESGSSGSVEQRVSECESAARQLGATLHFLESGGDGKIEGSRETALSIARIIRATRPHTLLAPSLVEDQHPDHSAIGRATR